MLRKRLEETIRKFLAEKTAAKRRGIELPDLAEKLKPYVRPNLQAEYFIHFGSVKKLGINPRTKFNTPMGIYAYPFVNEVYELLTQGSLPYAQEEPYLVLFKPKSFENVINIIPGKDLDKEEYDGLVSKMMKYANENMNVGPEINDRTPFQVGDILKRSQSYLDRMKKSSFFKDKPQILEDLSKRKYKVVNIREDGDGLVLFLEDAENPTNVNSMLESEFKDYELVKKADKMDAVRKVYQDAVRKSKHDTNISRFWNFTRLLAGNGKRWGWMFRKAGFNGFIDYTDMSEPENAVIHPNEPMQAVFFGRDLLDVINIFDNRLTPEKISKRDDREKMSQWMVYKVGDIVRYNDQYMKNKKQSAKDDLEFAKSNAEKFGKAWNAEYERLSKELPAKIEEFETKRWQVTKLDRKKGEVTIHDLQGGDYGYSVIDKYNSEDFKIVERPKDKK